MTESDHQAIESCPACDSDEIDRSVEPLDGICENCGLVIERGNNSLALDWTVSEGGFISANEQEWCDVCQVRNSTEKQLSKAFGKIEAITNRLAIPDGICEATVDLYCDGFREGVTDGRDTGCFVAACLRLGSRRINKPVPSGRITEPSHIEEQKVHQSRLALSEKLDLEFKTPTPADYLQFLSLELTLKEKEMNRTESLLQITEHEQEFIGKDPAGIAAGGVYLTAEGTTQSDVANAVGVSTATVRHRIEQLQDYVSNV